MKILVVEDDPQTAITLKDALHRAHHSVDITTSTQQALYSLKINHYDSIILDLIIGQNTGIEACRTIRLNNNSIPIIVHSILHDPYTKVIALEAGADDMVSKDTPFPELLARLQAMVRRKPKVFAHNVIIFQNLTLDTVNKEARLQGYHLNLTPKEYQLLEIFIGSPEKIFSRQEILERVWDMNIDPLTNKVDVYINFLRNKLKKHCPAQERYLQTLRGFGYRLAWKE